MQHAQMNADGGCPAITLTHLLSSLVRNTFGATPLNITERQIQQDKMGTISKPQDPSDSSSKLTQDQLIQSGDMSNSFPNIGQSPTR